MTDQRNNATSEPANSPWYAGGLRFDCTRCGACCVGEGLVEVSDVEIQRLSLDLGISEDAFRERYTRRLRGGHIGLVDRSGGNCAFYDGDGGCVVYRSRPDQCRSYPFWPSVLHSRANWWDEARCCPGIGRGMRRPAKQVEHAKMNAGKRV